MDKENRDMKTTTILIIYLKHTWDTGELVGKNKTYVKFLLKKEKQWTDREIQQTPDNEIHQI